MNSILITGGCGFIGSNLAVELAAHGYRVTVLDNLMRRGSEILLQRLLEHGIVFRHGDIRNSEDLERVQGAFDVLIECSAEPSVLVGSQGADARFLLNNNLAGSLNCFEWARQRGAGILFLSTSRVYPYGAINGCQFQEAATRFEFVSGPAGISERGLDTHFSLDGARSLYGASKLAAEVILQEYSQQYALPALINRCGVIAGPWQLGKVDQGVFMYWLAQHYFGRPLKYIGFGGAGKQVRDVLHIRDLTALVLKQLDRLPACRGEVYNVGGAQAANLSLCELTAVCAELTGRSLPIGSEAVTRPADVIWYVTDNTKVEAAFDWRPASSAPMIMHDMLVWLQAYEQDFRRVFGA